MEPVQILIAVAHATIGEAVQLALQHRQGMRVVVRANTVQETLALAGKSSANMLLLDPALSDDDGLDLICTLRDQYPRIRVLMFSNSCSENTMLRWLSAGAWGCVSNDKEFEVLVKAVRAVSEGEIWAPRRLLSQALLGGPISKPCQERNVQSLTVREREICHHVALGQTNKEIASKLFITEKTVKSHLNRIFRKLQVHRRVDLAIWQAGNRTHPR